ncbi:hypothetical protein PRCB_03640 [Pantoea rodasii]|uniref:Uncharacterized protein n=1 Tax=Pantoea rodasii TaxID=1076549 RepID=A0A2M9WH24_9GAMM|nr:hypothetical protein [Pantoea rodasii]PJZ06871.1 hypothetical protein PRCB_03640 [Pantoea rodasii]
MSGSFAISAKRTKTRQSIKKIEKRGCAKNSDPYNAPPLRRQSGNADDSAGSEEIRPAGEKTLKKVFDSEGEKRNIRPSQQQANALIAPLFNNLSDNLCGHSQD